MALATRDSDQPNALNGSTMPSLATAKGACTKASMTASEGQRAEEVTISESADAGTLADWEDVMDKAVLDHESLGERGSFDSPDELHKMGDGELDNFDLPPIVNIVPSSLDVLFGKGGTMNHAGNKEYRANGERLAPRYFENPTPSVEDAVALELVDFVFRRGGRFLDKDRESGFWQVAEFEKAHEKAKQLLRDLKKKTAAPTTSGKKRSHYQSDDGDNHDVPHSQGAGASPPSHKEVASKTPKPSTPKNARTKRGPEPHSKKPQSKKPVGFCLQQPIEGFACNKYNTGDDNTGIGQARVSTNYAAARCTEESPTKLFWVCVATSEASLRNSMVEGIKQLDDLIAGNNYSRNNNYVVEPKTPPAFKSLLLQSPDWLDMLDEDNDLKCWEDISHLPFGQQDIESERETNHRSRCLSVVSRSLTSFF